MKRNEKHLICVCGPTACGKTSTAIELAKHFNTEIISADSRQIYREMSIGTAVPTIEELNDAPHHFIHSHSVHDEFSAGDYAREAGELIRQLFEKHDTLILVGGTGFFVQALLYGFDAPASKDAALRADLNALYEKGGIEALHEKLSESGGNTGALSDAQNPQRVIRAIEKQLLPKAQKLTTGIAEEVRVSGFILSMPRELLYQRINDRVNQMMVAGLKDEVERLTPFKRLNSLKTVGYSELFRNMEGEITLDEAVELIQRNTRRYAKRQLTWFRNQTDFKEVEKPFTDNILNELN